MNFGMSDLTYSNVFASLFTRFCSWVHKGQYLGHSPSGTTYLPDIWLTRAWFLYKESTFQRSVEDEGVIRVTTIDPMLGRSWGFTCVQALASWAICGQNYHQSFVKDKGKATRMWYGFYQSQKKKQHQK